MLINNFSLSEYSQGRWVLTVEDRNILINENTAKLVQVLKDSQDLPSAHQKFSTLFTTNVSQEYFENLIQTKLGGYNLFKGEDTKQKQKEIQFLKFKHEVISAKYSGVLARPFVALFNPKIFKYLFFALTFLLFQGFSVYRPFDWSHFIGDDFLLFMALIVPNVMFHELGHIAACRQFKIKHGGIGVALYWIFPVCYADISNLWTLDKKKRIIANLGGIFLQLVYASILMSVFLVGKNYTLLYASFFISGAALIQFNPFVRFDGYWILSDISETPNLLSKSGILIRKFFKRSFLTNLFKRPISVIQQTKRSSIVVFLYGLANYLFMISFLGICLVNYHDDFLKFPVIVYGLMIKATQLKIESADLKNHYIYVLVCYILFFTLIKNMITNKFTSANFSGKQNITKAY